MSTVKRTFSISEDVSTELDEVISDQERSKFVTQSIVEALQKLHNKNLIDALDNIVPWEKSEESVIDIIRKIRGSRSAKLSSK